MPQHALRTPWRQSLQFNIGIRLIVLTTLILAGFGVYQYVSLKSEKLAYLTYLTDNTLNRLVNNLVTPLWEINDNQMHEVVLSEMGERTISAIVVKDSEQRLLTARIRDEEWQIMETQDEIPASEVMRRQDILQQDEQLGTVEIHLTQQFLYAELARGALTTAISILFVDVTIFLVFWFSLRTVLLRPMNRVLGFANAIAAGDFTQVIDIHRQDEIGKLAETFRNMQQAIAQALRETERITQAIREGNLESRGHPERFAGNWRDLVVGINHVIKAFVAPMTMTATTLRQIARGHIPPEITDAYKGDFNAIREDLNLMMHTLGTFTLDIGEAADHVASGSRDLSASADQMSQGASGQAATAEEVSASMEQISANIRQNAENARQTEHIAVASAAEAQKSADAVMQTITAMHKIAENIQVIEAIASQTHMLSLNATIEAAKAQDYGKGFAVVAAEVRSLAERSREAAEEINRFVNTCVTTAETAGAMLTHLVPNIQKTAGLVQEISAASQEQMLGADHINQAMQQLDLAIQQNVGIADATAATAEELSQQANALQKTAAFFHETDTLQTPDDEWRALLGTLQTLSDPRTRTRIVTALGTPPLSAPQPQEHDDLAHEAQRDENAQKEPGHETKEEEENAGTIDPRLRMGRPDDHGDDTFDQEFERY